MGTDVLCEAIIPTLASGSKQYVITSFPYQGKKDQTQITSGKVNSEF